MEGSGRHSRVEGRRQEWQGERVKTNGRRREGTRWEHVSHTEIVNYSFVLRRVGESSGRETTVRAGARVSRRHGWRKKTVSGGNGREQRICTRANGREREGCRRGARRDAGERTRRCISCFIGPLRPMLVTEVGWAVVRRWPVRARGKTKNEDEVNDIHAGYRILPSRARPRLPSFRLPFFFPSPLGRFPALSPPLTFSA